MLRLVVKFLANLDDELLHVYPVEQIHAAARQTLKPVGDCGDHPRNRVSATALLHAQLCPRCAAIVLKTDF